MTQAERNSEDTATLIKVIASILVFGFGGTVLVIFIDVALSETIKARINDAFSIVIIFTVVTSFIIAIIAGIVKNFKEK